MVTSRSVNVGSRETAVDREQIDQRREQLQHDLEEDEVRQAAAADRLLTGPPECGAVQW